MNIGQNSRLDSELCTAWALSQHLGQLIGLLQPAP